MRAKASFIGSVVILALLVGAPGAVASPPVYTARPHITGPPLVGGTLSTTHGTWSPAPTDYRYQWLTCVGSPCTPKVLGTDPTYVLLSTDVGTNVYVAVSAANGSEGVPQRCVRQFDRSDRARGDASQHLAARDQRHAHRRWQADRDAGNLAQRAVGHAAVVPLRSRVRGIM